MDKDVRYRAEAKVCIRLQTAGLPEDITGSTAECTQAASEMETIQKQRERGGGVTSCCHRISGHDPFYMSLHRLGS